MLFLALFLELQPPAPLKSSFPELGDPWEHAGYSVGGCSAREETAEIGTHAAERGSTFKILPIVWCYKCQLKLSITKICKQGCVEWGKKHVQPRLTVLQ